MKVIIKNCLLVVMALGTANITITKTLTSQEFNAAVKEELNYLGAIPKNRSLEWDQGGDFSGVMEDFLKRTIPMTQDKRVEEKYFPFIEYAFNWALDAAKARLEIGLYVLNNQMQEPSASVRIRNEEGRSQSLISMAKGVIDFVKATGSVTLLNSMQDKYNNIVQKRNNTIEMLKQSLK